MMRSALMTSIHHGWFRCSGTSRLDPDDAGTQPAVDASGQRPRGSVRAHPDGRSTLDSTRERVGGRDLDLGQGALELKLRYALDGGAAEQPAVADELETLAGAAGRAGRRSLDRTVPFASRRKRCTLRGKLGGPGVDRNSEATGEVGEEGDLVVDRRGRRPTQPVRPSFQVYRRSLTLEG